MIDPSTLPWWVWLLCGVGGFVVASGALFCAEYMEVKEGGCFAWIIGIVVGLAGLIAFGIGLIRFAKWAWG